MRLLHIIGSLNPLTGGPCQVIRNVIPELEQNGVYSHVVSLDASTAQHLGKDAFKVIALGPGKTSWCYSRKLLPWLIDNLSRYDLIIIHGLWLFHSYAVSKALRKLMRRAVTSSEKGKLPKVFIMPHGMLDPYFQRAPKRKFKAIRNAFYWALVERKVVREADGLLFTCEEELRLARTSFSAYEPKLEMNVGLGIIKPPPFNFQMQKAFRSVCNDLDSQPYFLFLGRIHEKKGVDMLLKAYAKFAKMLSKVEPWLIEVQGSELNYSQLPLKPTSLPKLVIAGPGTETPFGQEMQKLVQGNKELNKRVFFPGMLTGDAKWAAFYGCEAFILPSHQENFGIAVAEALACGKPVLISNKVNIWREIINSGGGLVAEETSDGVFEMLQIWMGLSLSDKASLGSKARRTYEKHFSIGPATKKLFDAITQVSFSNV